MATETERTKKGDASSFINEFIKFSHAIPICCICDYIPKYLHMCQLNKQHISTMANLKIQIILFLRELLVATEEK